MICAVKTVEIAIRPAAAQVRKNRECLFQEEPEAARDGSLAAPANAGARPGWREQCMRLLHPDPYRTGFFENARSGLSWHIFLNL